MAAVHATVAIPIPIPIPIRVAIPITVARRAAVGLIEVLIYARVAVVAAMTAVLLAASDQYEAKYVSDPANLER